MSRKETFIEKANQRQFKAFSDLISELKKDIYFVGMSIITLTAFLTQEYIIGLLGAIASLIILLLPATGGQE